MNPEEHSRRGDVDYFRTVDVKFLKNYRLEKSGGTCLHIAASDGQLECCKVIYERCPSLLFIENSYGNTFFHHVYGERLTSMLQFFLEMGAKVEAEGNTVTKSRYKHLLEKVNYEGQTALCRGIENGMIDEEPSNHDITKLWIKADNMYDLELLTILNRSKQTLMHSAVENQDLELVKLLLAAKPNFVYGDDNNGDTPLMIAIGKTLSQDTSISAEIEKLLAIKQSVQITVNAGKKRLSVLHNYIGNTTPLHIAAFKRIQDMVPHLLCDSRADITKTNDMGENTIEELSFEDARDEAFWFDEETEDEVKYQNDSDLVVITVFAALSLATVFVELAQYITDDAKSVRMLLVSTSFGTFAISNVLVLTFSLYALITHVGARYILKR